MDMNLVRTFVAVYQHRSYTEAAASLGLTQPAVSMAIKRLEAESNKALFIKSGRGIAPTLAADHLANAFQRSLELVENALSEQSELYAYCAEAVLHRLGDIDGITFRLPPLEQEVLFYQLRRQQIDLVIDIITQQDAAFVFEPLYSETLKVIARKGHPRICADTLTEDSYYQEQHVAFMARRNGKRIFEMAAKSQPRARIDKVEVSSSSAMVMMVSETDYLGVVSASFAEKWAPKLGLQVLDMPFPCESVTVHMTYHSRVLSDPYHKKMRELVKGRLVNKARLLQ
ncbi:MAG: LysR family transcriptional regulator [Endozoicomonas sp.]